MMPVDCAMSNGLRQRWNMKGSRSLSHDRFYIPLLSMRCIYMTHELGFRNPANLSCCQDDLPIETKLREQKLEQSLIP